MTIEAERPATYREIFAVAEFRALLLGYGAMLVGESVKMLALAVLVYAGTGSTLLAALAYVAGFLPNVLGGTFLLALADRWKPRTVMVAYDVLRLVVAVILALGVLPPFAMLALVFVTGTVTPLAQAARTALLPDLLEGDAYVLGRSIFTVMAGGTQVLGAAVGGLLLATVGASGALWLTALTCLLSVLLVRFGIRDHPARSTTRGGAVRETWRVNRALLADPVVRPMLLAQWLPAALMVGAEGVVVPYADELGRAPAAGVLLMAAAGGMLIGDLLVGRFVAPARREALTSWLALLLGVPLLGLVLRPGLVPAAALLALAATGFSYHLGLARRFLDAVPVERRGQSLGLLNTGTMTLQGLTMAAAGALAEVFAPGTVMAIAGAASVLSTVVFWRRLTPQSPAGPSSR